MMAQLFEQLVCQDDRFEIVVPRWLTLVCFRLKGSHFTLKLIRFVFSLCRKGGGFKILVYVHSQIQKERLQLKRKMSVWVSINRRECK